MCVCVCVFDRSLNNAYGFFFNYSKVGLYRELEEEAEQTEVKNIEW